LRRFAPARLKERADRRLARFEMRDLDQSGPSDVPILSGCFMLVRRANLERVGGFDERFFLYLEDYDLCNRLRQTGRLVYLPTVAIHHHHGRHSYRRIKPLLLHLRSAQQYFGKWGWLPLY
jgi:GT2 family glycosyltransferase